MSKLLLNILNNRCLNIAEVTNSEEEPFPAFTVEVAAAEVDPEVTSSLAEDRAVSSNVASAVEGKNF